MSQYIKGMFSILIPCHKLFRRTDGKYEVEACIDSILDQDYKNYEIIVGANGPDKDKIVSFIKDNYEKVRTVEVTEANAAHARNAAALLASGEYRTYFSCDLQMKPGCLSIWAKHFEKNPKVDALYGDIDMMEKGVFTGTRLSVYAGDYDPYLLECFNLMDGAYPLRSKVDGPWNPDVKALQDWDHALTLKDNGANFKRIEDVCYYTEKPKEGGLSDYFSKNWLALQKQIRGLHSIPMREICVTSLGAPMHALRTAKLLDADFLPMPSYHEHEYKIVYLLGYYTNNMPGHNAVFKGMAPNALRVIHWIGTDILQMMGLVWEVNANVVDALNEYIDIQFSECGNTQAELARMQLNTHILPLAVDVSKYEVIKEVPKKFTVAVYTPGHEEIHYAKYNLTLMYDLVKAMPDIDFVFFGDSKKIGPEKGLKNLRHLGYTTMKEVAEKANVILRFPIHDGLPISPIEMILQGRDAITTIPMNGAFFAGNGRVSSATVSRRKDELISAIRYIQKNPRKLEDRMKDIEYWRNELSPENFKKRFMKVCKARQKVVDARIKEYEEKKKNAKTQEQKS
jgi:glycosyltransferase involved in cell wall biosynthesis